MVDEKKDENKDEEKKEVSKSKVSRQAKGSHEVDNHLSPEMSPFRRSERTTELGHPLQPECLHPVLRVSIVRDVLNALFNKNPK
ncbi:hypothetical protein KIN20_013400 [Parelaphostrongylus tenuis]|uniref:Uncharacterized protein n=1 Tax=Parelaphostrongylus tenuis TaxID=148309 RepID=A0AAD5QL05_PARTN|nr:hypothetical protein KIN20_013400 [Parelaphostrongylus tenuis]